MKILTNTLLTDLKGTIDPHTLSALCLRHQLEQHTHTDHPTTTTSLSRGSAISRGRPGLRPHSKAKDKLKDTFRASHMQVGKWPTHQQSIINKPVANQTNKPSRKVLADRAVYYGEVDLPYLHSSDALSCLYQKKKRQDGIQEPLLNPSANIAPSALANVKSLYLYYTGIDSVRQLGTGWSNLKSLTIMCSRQLRDLSGLSIFPSLEHLYCPFNQISDISDLMYHSSLRCVDLQANQLSSLDQVEYLYTLRQLEWVNLSANPISHSKQQFRIIKENLGEKLEPDHDDRLHQYVEQQIELDYELYSYANIQHSNALIRSINDQILSDHIPIGAIWNRVSPNPTDPIADVEIIDQTQDQQSDSQRQQQDEVWKQTEGWNQKQSWEKEQEQGQRKDIQLRVTPLVTYLDSKLDLSSLNKYFLNKVCLQVKTVESSRREPSIINQDKISKKFGATQSFTRKVNEEHRKGNEEHRKGSEEHRGRLGSSSNPKKLSRLSLPKNSLKIGQPESCELNPSAVKFLSKRRFMGNFSESKLLDAI